MLKHRKNIFSILLTLGMTGCGSDLSVMSSNLLGTNKVTVIGTDKVDALAGDHINIRGTGFTKELWAEVAGKKAALELIDSENLTLTIPTDAKNGVNLIGLFKEKTLLAEIPILIGDESQKLPIMAADPKFICNDLIFRDASGKLGRGERNCSLQKACDAEGSKGCVANENFPAIKKAGLESKIVLGAQVIGIVGTAVTGVPCSDDQVEPCLVDGVQYVPVERQSILASDLRTGVSLAGVSGLFDGTPATCSADAQLSCVANASFPAVNKALTLMAQTHKYHSSLSIAGVQGTLSDCASDGAVDCYATTDFPVVDKAVKLAAPALAQIHSSLTIAGSTGTLSDCAADGGTACRVLGPNFAALATGGAAPKILMGQSLGAIPGTAPLAPSACGADGGTDCITSSNFPAIDKTVKLSPGNLAKIRTNLTIAGLSGTLGDCAIDGDSSCVAMGPSFAAAFTTGAAAKIMFGETLAGITGTAALRPADCSVDGGTACTTTSAFPSADVNGASTKILSGQILGGVTGISVMRPADCAADADLNCVATAAFPAALAAGADSKILAGQTLAGISGLGEGRPIDCAAEGALSCVAVSNFPAIDKANKLGPTQLEKIRSSLSIAGESGTLSDCAADADVGCFANSSFPAALAAGAESKLIAGQVLGGKSGNVPPKPADCAVDGAVGCVAISDFPAVDKVNNLSAPMLAKIHSSLTIAGVQGTLDDCTLDGESACETTSSFPSAAIAGAAAKIALGDTLAGVSGTANVRPSDCDIDGDVACVTNAAFPAALAAGANLKIALGETLGGMAGSASVRPSDCSTDGGTGCVATNNFPVVDKALHLTAGNMAKVRSSHAIAGVAGTLADCVSDGDENCVAVGPAVVAANKTGAAAKILNGQSVAGINGTAPVRPADCAADEGTSCVTVANFPAVDKLAKLSVGNAALIHDSLSFLGVSGSMADCALDAEENCYAVSGFPAAQVAGAAAKILIGQNVAGVAGSAPLKPADCSADAAVGCVTVSDFPAVDKQNKLLAEVAKIHSSLTLAGVTGTLADCASDGVSSCLSNATYIAANTTGAAAKILTGQTLAGQAGSGAGRPADCASDGALGCVSVASYRAANATGAAAKITLGQTVAGIAGSAPVRPGDCDEDADLSCVTVANFPAVDKATKLTANTSKILSSLTIAGVAGAVGNCSTDGFNGCLAVAGFPAADTSGAAAKIMNGQTLAGVAGTAPVKPANCSGDNATNCVAIASNPSVVLSNITGNTSKIRSGVTIAATAGALPNCSTDGGVDCVAVAGYLAANSTGAAAKILLGQTVAGIAGSAPLKPADCSAGNVSGCTSVTAYPAIQKSLVTEGVIKSGSTILGVAGLYPNATYPLAGSDPAVTDITTGNFDTTINSASNFEWFDANGTRYMRAGDTNISVSKIKTGQDIFGTTGTFGGNCTGDGQTDCMAVAAYKTADTNAFTEWDIRRGHTYAGVAGKLLFVVNSAHLGGFNRTTGADASASTTVADYYDSQIDWYWPTETVNGFYSHYFTEVWLRDPTSDSNSNGTCDGAEACVYKDQVTNRYWAKEIVDSYYTWEDAITYCEGRTYGGYTDWRMPMEKEFSQARVDGLHRLWGTLHISGEWYWTANTRHNFWHQAYAGSPGEPMSGYRDKVTEPQRILCIR